MKTKIILYLLIMLNTLSYSKGKDPQFKTPTIQELNEKNYPLDVEAHAAVLIKSESVNYVFRVDRWYQIREVRKRIKIYDTKGFEYAKVEIEGYNNNKGSKEIIYGIKAKTYLLKNGVVEEVKLKKKEIYKEDFSEFWFSKKFTLPSLEPGCIVEYKYKIESPYTLYIDRYQLQEHIPVKECFGSIIFPEYFVFKLFKIGSLPVELTYLKRNMKSLKGHENTYTIYTHNIPAFKEEAHLSSEKNYILSYDFDLSYVKYPGELEKYYSTETWEDVAKKAYKEHKYKYQLKRDKYYREDITRLQLEGKSDSEKIAEILSFVKEKVKWNGKKGKRAGDVKKTYTKGEGKVADINLILTSVLRNFGFKANPVLISTRQNGISYFPTNKGYNYLITAVEDIEEQPILLDATEKYSYLNLLPFRDINWEGRLIREDLTTEEINLFPKTYDFKKNKIVVKIDDNLEFNGRLKSYFSGYSALKYRKETNELNDESHIKKIEKNYRITINNLSIENKNDLSKSYSLIANFTSDKFIEEINSKLYIDPFLFVESNENPFKLKERNYPVDFGYPWKIEKEIVIQYPKGYICEFLPKKESFTMTDGIGSFEYDFKDFGGFVKITCTKQCNTGIIPTTYYTELKEFYNKMIKNETQKLVLVKKLIN